MSARGGGADFGRWAETILAGSGWTLETVREAADRPRDDLATGALADGFAAAVRGASENGGGDECGTV